MRTLVCIPTYEKERYALVPLLRGLQEQRFQAFDILMVDNTPGDDYVKLLALALEKAFPKKKCDVLHVSSEGNRFRRIIASREAARDWFLSHPGYTHLFFLDSDVILPRSALIRLIGVRKDLVTGVYLNAVISPQGNTILPCLFIDKEGGARQATIREVLSSPILEVGAAGLGCTLATRAVVEKAGFDGEGKGEDVRFYRAAIAAGFKAYAITGVKCLHLHAPLGDPINKVFDLNKYKIGKP